MSKTETQTDDHTGFKHLSNGIVYTYEHADDVDGIEAVFTDVCDGIYQVECHLVLKDRPVHRNVYFVRGDELDRFFSENAQCGEIVTDVRPVSFEEMKAHIQQYE